MNQSLNQDPVSKMCLAGAVVASGILMQEMTGFSPFTPTINFFLHKVRIRLPTLALKPRGDVNRSPKQWPTIRTYVLQKFEKKIHTRKLD